TLWLFLRTLCLCGDIFLSVFTTEDTEMSQSFTEKSIRPSVFTTVPASCARAWYPQDPCSAARSDLPHHAARTLARPHRVAPATGKTPHQSHRSARMPAAHHLSNK